MTLLTSDEYRGRQAAAIAAARARDYDLVLAWGRGASTQDHAADVLYLTGYYTPQPFMPDLLAPRGSAINEPVKRGHGTWRWRATGHAAVILATDGKVTLVADQEPRAGTPPVADRVLITTDPVGAVGNAIAGLARFNRAKCMRVAVVGGEALAGRWERALHACIAEQGETHFEDADDLVWTLRTAKSPAEQMLLRSAGALGARGMAAAMAAAVPGATEADVVAAFVAEVIRGGGAWYGGGLSSGPWAYTFAPTGGEHGAAPSTLHRLAAGELLRFDAYGSVGGYLFDLARSWVVGRRPTPGQQMLLDAVRDSVTAGLEKLRPGVTLGDVARRCDAVLASSVYARRFGVPASTMSDAWGHGLGLGFEPPWISIESDVVVEPGMCFAVERRIEAPHAPPDARGAQYEEDVLVTEYGVDLLTPAPSRYGEDAA